MHGRHLLTVPFEKLDIHLARPIILREATFFEKLVGRRRGGFCYELNGLFTWLLERLGFDVERIAARVTTEGRVGLEFDHLTLLVRLDEPWLVDVGFGQSFRDPLPLVADVVHEQGHHAYRLDRGDREWSTHERGPDGTWAERYRFTLEVRELREFEGMCPYHQESPESPFTRPRVCSRATPDGRLTLTETAVVETIGTVRRESSVDSDADYRTLLCDRFGIELGEAPWRRPPR